MIKDIVNTAYTPIINVLVGFVVVVRHQNLDAPKEGIDGIENTNDNMITHEKIFLRKKKNSV
jgi:hypothetical protein